MMRYCFWHGIGDPEVDDLWLDEALESLNCNTWNEPLYMNGSDWDGRRQRAAIKFFESLAGNTSCPAFTILNATMNSAVTGSFEKAMEQNKTIRSLTLGNVSTLMSQMLEMPYNLPDCVFSNPNLVSLNLKHVSLDQAGCLRLCQSIHESKTLCTLSLHAVNMSKEALPSVFAAISMSTSLTSLKLSNMEWGADDIKLFWEALLLNQTIATLSIDNLANIKDVLTGADIVRLLQRSKSLAQLSLRSNDLDGIVLDKILSQGLVNNKTLVKLDYSNNRLGLEAALQVASFLGDTASCSIALEELLLMNCQIPEAGCVEIARAIQFNKTLRTLRLDRNQLQACGQVLVDSLEHNFFLQQILSDSVALPFDTHLWKQLDLHLRANQAHRHFVVRRQSEALYLPLVARVLHQCGGADIMYHFLRHCGESLWTSQVTAKTTVPKQPPATKAVPLPSYKSLESNPPFSLTCSDVKKSTLRQCTARGA